MSLKKELAKLLRPLVGSPANAEHSAEIARLKEDNEVLRSIIRYGNTVATWANEEGAQRWKEARDSFGGPVDGATHQAFRDLGFVYRENFLDADVVAEMAREFDAAASSPEKAYNPFLTSPKLLKAYSDGPLPGPVPDCRLNLRDTDADVPSWHKIFDERLVNFVRDCLGSNFEVTGLSASRNMYCPPEYLKVFEPFSDRWHLDDQLPDVACLFVNLKNVTLDDGPFHLHTIPNTRRLLSLGYDKRKRRESIGCGLPAEVYEDPPSTKQIGGPGTITLARASFCMHRAGTPNKGHSRDLIYFYLRPSKEMRLTPPADGATMM